MTQFYIAVFSWTGRVDPLAAFKYLQSCGLQADTDIHFIHLKNHYFTGTILDPSYRTFLTRTYLENQARTTNFIDVDEATFFEVSFDLIVNKILHTCVSTHIINSKIVKKSLIYKEKFHLNNLSIHTHTHNK